MNRRVWLLVFVLVAVAALALAAWAVLGAAPPAPLRTRLDVNLGEPSTVYTTQAGEYAITLTLEPKGDDNGPVLITLTANGKSVGRLNRSTITIFSVMNLPVKCGWRGEIMTPRAM